MKPERIWYIVMNSNRARILRQLPDVGGHAPLEITMQAVRQNLRHRLRDKPTRSFSTAGGGRRSAVEPPCDPLRDDAVAFLHDVFRYLQDEQAIGAFDGLVLIGSPDIVGLWRDELPAALKASVRCEITKNLVRLPIAELAPAVRAALSERAARTSRAPSSPNNDIGGLGR